MFADSTNKILAVVTFICLALAFLLPGWALFFGNVVLGKGLVVMGLVLLARSGLVPFGQALFFAGGAYGAGLLIHNFGITDLLALTLMGAIVGGLLAFASGFLLARYRGIFFAMLSLAFSMILYGILVKTESLGSTDGIGLEKISLFGMELGEHFEFYVYLFSIVIAFIAAVGLNTYFQSIPGRLSSAIRDNEVRVEYLGLSVTQLVHKKLIISGILAGLGGVITAASIGHIDPDMAYWTTSGGFVFVTILAGTGSVMAPFLGALVFEVIRSAATAYLPDFWQIILGSALLLSIVFLPGGLWSLISRKKGSN